MAPTKFSLNVLQTAVPTIFDQSQMSAASHKKNCVALHKLQSAAAIFTETVTRGRSKELMLSGEKAFTEVFLDMLNRALIVKKGISAGDRVIKFVASYVKFLSEKVSQQTDVVEEENVQSRFISRLLRHFIRGLSAKDKFVRFRVVSLVSEMLEYLGEIDQDLYIELRAGLIARLHDKESFIRAQSVIGLSKLAVTEDPSELEEDDDQPILGYLLCSLATDSAAEVRRSALVHIPFTPFTLNDLLKRSRDPDALTRKLIYSAVLPRLSHPKQLSIAQREKVVQEGLGDREDAVRVAAAKLLGSWVDLGDGDLTAFLQLFDVRTSTDVAVDALKSVFVTRTEVVDAVEFDEGFWSHLRPETALLARTFVEYCMFTQDATRLEATLPVVTALAFQLQSQYNAFLSLASPEQDENDEEANDAREDDMANIEFIMIEILNLALHLDYADEIGRRKMFGVVREMLGHSALPDSFIQPSMAVLSILSPDERDLVRVVVELINELRDPDTDIMNPSSSSSTVASQASEADSTTWMSQTQSTKSGRSRKQVTEMTPEEKAAADMADLRCLTICVALLERVNGNFEDNSTLDGILADLIVPSVKRKELALRESGLASLGLCCLIAKNMAINSFQLFLSQVKSVPESLRLKNIQIVFDLLMTYEGDLLGENSEIAQRIIAFLMQVLEAEESKAVQAMICLGLSKLMLFGLVTDERVLTSLVLAYVSPVTATNPELRQCLAYFLPVYCYSSPENQNRMQSVFLTAFDLVSRIYEDMEDDQSMISPLQFGQLLIDWTDPTKAIEVEGSVFTNRPVHMHLTIDLLKALYDSDRSDEDKKVLVQLLGKLSMPQDPEESSLFTAVILFSNLANQCPFDDASSDKLFTKAKARFEKHFATSLESFDERECFESGKYAELYEFIGVSNAPQKRQKKLQPSSSLADESEQAVVSDTDEALKAQHKTSKSREEEAGSSGSEASSESSNGGNDDIMEISQPKAGPSRSRKPPPKKPATRPSVRQREPLSSASASTEGEEQPKERQTVPVTPVKKRGSKRIHTPSKTPSKQSPAPKRQNRGARSKAPPKLEPLNNATHKRTNGTRKSAPSLRGRPGLCERKTEFSEEVDEQSHADDSDESVPSPIPPRLIENIGWDGSSDI